MSTTFVTLAAGAGWQLASSASDYLVQNIDSDSLLVTVQESAPADNAPYHELRRGQAFSKVGSGSAYVRNPSAHEVRVAVTE